MQIRNVVSLALVPFALAALVGAAGCSSKNSSAASGKKGGGASAASAALKAGQKEGKNLAANKDKAAKKGATTGGTGKQKNGGAHAPAEAAAAGEKAGSVAMGDQSKAKDEGAELSSVACDDSHEAVGFCADDAHLDFCHEGHWYALDCTTAENGAFCGEDLTSHTVDCWVEAELVVTGEVVACDDAAQGTAFCEDDGHALFCDGGEWLEETCGDVVESGVCIESDDSHAVDCAADGSAVELASFAPRFR